VTTLWDPFGLTFALVAAALGTLLLVSARSELGELRPPRDRRVRLPVRPSGTSALYVV